MHSRLNDLKEEEVCYFPYLFVNIVLWFVQEIYMSSLWSEHLMVPHIKQLFYEILNFETRMADYKKSKRLEQKKRRYPEVQIDEEIAAAMGFGGFGTTKK